MPTLVMPKLGLTMEEGRIAEWKVAAGDTFRAGDVLIVVETDKISSEVEATGNGIVNEILAAVDDVLPVGAPLATWAAKGKPAGQAAGGTDPAPGKPAENASAPGAASTSGGPVPAAAGRRILATPLARREARERGIDIASLTGTGPRGRIKQKDVIEAARNAAADTPAEAAGTKHAATEPPTEQTTGSTIFPTAWQRVAAEQMVRSKATIPHFYISTEIDSTPLESALATLRAAAPDRRITVTHLMLLAIGRALQAMPEANRVWSDGGYKPVGKTNVGLAIATAKGLSAPIIEECDGAIWDIAARAEAVVERARSDRLDARDFEHSAAISLSNAGMHDVSQMISIIPPGQTSILGIGSIRSVFRPDEEGRPVLKREMIASLSCDHRVLDGISAIRFLNLIKDVLTNPMTALLAPART